VKEPFRSEFIRHLHAGAGAKDIHDAIESDEFRSGSALNAQYVAREVERVAAHQRSLCRTLERRVGKVDTILDVGCSTGGTTVALALSKTLDARAVLGIDPNAVSLEAAPARARAYEVEDRARFQHVPPGPLPFADAAFDLVVSVSVLEFITHASDRESFVSELQRVTRPGGFVYLSTPSPLRLRELHSRRILGDFRKRDNMPWATPSWEIKRMLADCTEVPLGADIVAAAVERVGLDRPPRLPAPLLALLPRMARWQKMLFQRR
jgi:SAM-dependent methyltransferase